MSSILVINDDTGVLEPVKEILIYEGYVVAPLTACEDFDHEAASPDVFCLPSHDHDACFAGLGETGKKYW